MVKVFDGQGSEQDLDELLAKGGEGSIYPLRKRPDVLIKVYHPEIVSKRGKALQEKVDAMCQIDELKKDRRLSWPLLSVYDRNKQWVGYAMYRAKGQPMFKLAHTCQAPGDP